MQYATRFAAVAILVAAGCATGDDAGLTVASNQCVYVEGTPDEGPGITGVVCEPGDVLPVPSGGMGLVLAEPLGDIRFDGRIYVSPAEIRSVRLHQFQPVNPPPGTSVAGEATVRATAFENDAFAPARVEVWQHGNHVTTSSSGTPFTLVADTYDITLSLDELLDRPYQTFRIDLVGGQDASIDAKFSSSILEVRILRDGEPAAGMATVLRDNEPLGTMGSHVSRRLSAGTYDVAVRHRTETRLFEAIHLAPTQRRALIVDF